MIEKAKIRGILDSALHKLHEHGRISDAEVEKYQENFDDSNLVIGVIGKMKAGKSSLVNSVVFGDTILPSGSEPMTVTLTEITYGDSDSAEVELLTKKDIEELKRLADPDEPEAAGSQRSKNAREALQALPKNYESTISKGKITIPLSELSNYVSTSGKISGLAKVVKITIHNDNLKGIKIIDTPGFNDPVLSRGETTKNCLSKCNVLLFVHNEDGYDEVDASLLQEQIEYAGIAELIDIYNKVDIINMPLSEWDDQLEYFIERRKKYLAKFSKDTNVVELTADSQSIIVSSLMALCGQIDKSKLTPFMKEQKSLFQERYEELTDLFSGETVESKLIEKSNVNQVIDSINRIAKNSAKYLSTAPILTLEGKLESVIDSTKDEIDEKKLKIKSLNEDIKDVQREESEIRAFFDDVKDYIEVNTLENEMNESIKSTFDHLCSRRKSIGEREFTEEKFRDPKFGQSGITKHNLSHYNNLVSSFEDDIRLSEQALIRSMSSITNAYVRSIRLHLVNIHISEEQREFFEKSLSNSMTKIIDKIDIIIDPHLISKLPDGNLNQYALLKKCFLSDFNDKYINKQMSDFKEVALTLGDPQQVMPILSNLRSELLNALSASPEQREREKEEAEGELKQLKEDLVSFQGLLEDLTTLLKNK